MALQEIRHWMNRHRCTALQCARTEQFA